MIDFDPVSHRYSNGGLLIPSVTSILTFMDQTATKFMRQTGAKERGTDVHKMLQDWDNGLFVPFEWDHLDEVFLTQYRSFLEDYRLAFDGIEKIVYHEELNYCGTVDRLGREWDLSNKERLFICDFKTGTTVPPSARLQTAGYALAAFPNDYKEVERYSLHLNPKLKRYKIKAYQDPSDFIEWRILVREYHKRTKEN